MTQNEFLKQLKESLEKRGVEKVSDILTDYQEHFTHGLQNGKTEEEISTKLGSPQNLALAFETESMIEKVKDKNSRFQWEMSLKVLGRLLILAPFNFLVLFIPGALIFAFLVTAWSVAAGLGGAGIGVIGASFFAGFLSESFWALIACLSAGLGVLGLALLSGMISFKISQYVILMTIDYLKWNLKFVLEKH